MSCDVGNDVGIIHDAEIESPVLVDAGLPLVLGLVIFLGPQRRMAQVLKQQQRLLVKDLLDFLRRLLVSLLKWV